MSSPLASKLAASYKQNAEQSREQQQRFLEERRMLRTLGPKCWESLRDLFRETVTGMNVEVNRDLWQWFDLASNMLKITKTDNSASIQGVFDAESLTLSITGPHEYDSMTYELKVLGNDVQFVTTRLSENRPQSIEEIVAKALNKLTY
jgi:hypothetical protein